MSFGTVRYRRSYPDAFYEPLTLDLPMRGSTLHLGGKEGGYNVFAFPAGNARITFTAQDLAVGVAEMVRIDFGAGACNFLQQRLTQSLDAGKEIIQSYLENLIGRLTGEVGGFPSSAYKECAKSKGQGQMPACAEAVEYTVRSVNKMFNAEGGFNVGGAVMVIADVAVSITVGQFVKRIIDTILEKGTELLKAIVGALSDAICGASTPSGEPIDTGAPPTQEPGTIPGAPGPGTAPPSGGGGPPAPPSSSAPALKVQAPTVLGLKKRTWTWIGLGAAGVTAYYIFARGTVPALAPVERGLDKVLARGR